MTFGEQYIKHLDVIQNIGMSRIDEVTYEAPLAEDPTKTVKVKIIPLQFLKAVLPNPQDLGENYEGETSIGCRIRGIKDGKEHTYIITAPTAPPMRRLACRVYPTRREYRQ